MASQALAGRRAARRSRLAWDCLTAKYAPLVSVLRDLIARPDTPLSGDVKQHILDQLDRAFERFAALRS
jgi:hypothetical protein